MTSSEEGRTPKATCVGGTLASPGTVGIMASVQTLEAWGSVPPVSSSSHDRTPRNILPCSQPPTLSASRAHPCGCRCPKTAVPGFLLWTKDPCARHKATVSRLAPAPSCPSPPITRQGCDSLPTVKVLFRYFTPGQAQDACWLLGSCCGHHLSPGAAAVPHWLMLSTKLSFNPPESISRALQGALGSSLTALGPSLPFCWACWLHPVRGRDASPGRPGGGFSASLGPT